MQPALGMLRTGMLYNADYVLEPGRHEGRHTTVLYGHVMDNPDQRVGPRLQGWRTCSPPPATRCMAGPWL